MVTAAQSDVPKHPSTFHTDVTFCGMKMTVFWYVALYSLVEID
jgi:hypothetical protein